MFLRSFEWKKEKIHLTNDYHYDQIHWDYLTDLGAKLKEKSDALIEKKGDDEKND
jgi:hypothetical protein